MTPMKYPNLFNKPHVLSPLKRLLPILGMAVCCIFFSCATADRKTNYTYDLPAPKTETLYSDSFVLGEGDELSIFVWRHEDLQRNVTVNPSGYIYVPLAGEIKAAGLTVPELKADLSERLAKYINTPRVDINTTTIHSRKVYILGEIDSPGSLVLDQKTAAIEAISKSRGFTADANKQRILLIRADHAGQYKVMVLNLDFAMASADTPLSYNVMLQNKDILFVPPLKIANFERLMNRFENILSPILSIERIITLWPEVKNVLQGNGENDRTMILTN